MVPILYSANETSFVSNGLGRLSDCISCEVTEERNGIYECEFKYPVTGRFYQELLENAIIGVIHDDKHDIQPFDVYAHSAPINGIVTFNAHHISYRLSRIIVKPFSAGSAASTLQNITVNSVNSNPFTFWTDKAVSSSFVLKKPSSARSVLVGEAGSVLDVYGKGEYEFDKFTVKL